jgi:hypothetical protein
MDLAAIVNALNLKVRCCEDKLDKDVQGGFVGDLLSDVMANSKEGSIWITRQVHQNIIAVASLRDLAGIILVQDSEPAKDTLEKAINEGIPVMISAMTAFDVAGKLYNMITADGVASAATG